MKDTNAMLLKAAVAGLVGATLAAAPGTANAAGGKKSKKIMKEVVKCYGVNTCAGKGQCSGKGHECAGQNGCKGTGWLYIPKESCTSIEGGLLEPPQAPAAPTTQQQAPAQK